MFLDDGDEHVDGDGDPDLSFDGVFGRPEEALDAQMLLDPLEEEFDLPSAFVQRAHGQGWELKVICEKDKSLARFRVLEADTAKMLRIALTRKRSTQEHGLIAHDSGSSVRG